MKLEVGKTYRHGTDNDETNLFDITERCTDYYVGQARSYGKKRWLFDENGKALACFGSTIKPGFFLREIVEEEVVYVRLNNYGDISVSATPNLGTSVTDIKVTFRNGIAVSAELEKPNVDKTSKNSLLL